MITYKEMLNMTDAELSAKARELSNALYVTTGAVWDDLYKEYVNINDVLDERYRERNQAEFNAFYKRHIKGKSWEEIDPEAWQCYSDWHKDMYGFRPKHI
jgi:hypothetical protein